MNTSNEKEGDILIMTEAKHQKPRLDMDQPSHKIR